MAAIYKFVGEAALTQLIELCHTLALKPKFVKELPDTGDERYIYFVYNSSSTDGKNLFDEYVWVVPTEQGVEPRWELLGSVQLEIALDGYVTKETFDALEKRVEEIESGEVSNVEFDTTSAPEITIETSKDGTVVKAKVVTDLSNYAEKSDLDGLATEDYVDSAVKNVEDEIPVLEEITADEVKETWEKYNGD